MASCSNGQDLSKEDIVRTWRASANTTCMVSLPPRCRLEGLWLRANFNFDDPYNIVRRVLWDGDMVTLGERVEVIEKTKYSRSPIAVTCYRQDLTLVNDNAIYWATVCHQGRNAYSNLPLWNETMFTSVQ